MKIIRYNNKHDDSYYVADTSDQVRASMLAELKDTRVGYYEPWGEVWTAEADRPILALSDEEVEALPQPFKEQAQAKRRVHKREQKEYALHDRIAQRPAPLLSLPLEQALVMPWPDSDHYALDVIRVQGQGHEYESWHIIDVPDALVDLRKRSESPQPV